MKKKFSEVFKGKGYFVLLFIGVIAIAAVAFIGSRLSANDNPQDQQYVDLNDTGNDKAAADQGDTKLAENNPVSEGVANNGSASSQDTAASIAQSAETASRDVEYDDYSNTASNTGKTPAVTKQPDKPKPGKTTKAEVDAALAALSFHAEDGMAWPVKGNVIMNYSMDHTTYFATLMQYKCNPAIIFEAKVGEEVKAAKDGIVTAIDANNEETGYTVTVGIGSGFDLVYGQLNEKSVNLKVGDSVKEGDVIGTVADPTKYYTVEGSNLYFEVTKNDNPVDPMLYLK